MADIDHLNFIERKLIDKLREGEYNTITAGNIAKTNAWVAGAGTPPTNGEVAVYGQFPTTAETVYPCIITEMAANGIEEQFMGQKMTSGSSTQVGELYGVAFNIFVSVDRDSSMSVDTGSGAETYKERRLLNYLMLNVANVLMDIDFTEATFNVTERHFSGFRDIGYNPDLETWNAICSMVVVFKNTR
tara:strand:+ start:1895 stop:2458 length:564 start_codon:yes stop_codon:yes gene_type:complete